MAGKINSIDYRDGGNEFAKRIKIHLLGGTLTEGTFEGELNAWNSEKYEDNRTQVQIDATALRSHAALLREVKAVQEEVIANESKIIASHGRVVDLYTKGQV